jgi:cobalt-zinc-cadmium resistance protein CzcA
MIKKLVALCVHQPAIIILLTLICMAAGILSFLKLPIDAVPDITNTQVQIITRVDGMVPEEIERKVTFPIESALNGIIGVTQSRSITRFGISHVTVVFDEFMDIYKARQLVMERLTSIIPDLPQGIRPELGPISTGLGEIFHYQVEAIKKETGAQRLLQLMELRALQDWFVRPRLLRVKGVTEINTIGGYEKQYHIQPDLSVMKTHLITFDDIAQAVKRNNLSVGGGYIQEAKTQFLIQADGLLKGISDIEEIPIKVSKSLNVIKIKDVAKVRLSTELRNGAALINGEESVLGTVMMTMGENSRLVAQRVAEEVQKINKIIPEGYTLNALYDRSVMVDATLLTVEKNLLFGCALVVLFLLLLVGNIQAALIVALVIPVSLLMTFILMKMNGISGNLMSLGCLDFGIIIDSAVIVVDATMRLVSKESLRLGRPLSRDEIKITSIDGTSHVFKEAFFGQLIIVLVFLPIFALTGVEGKMFVPIATTFVYALLAALVLSFTLVPTLCGLLLPGKIAVKKPWLMRQAEHIFAPLFERALNQRKAVMITVLVIVFCSGLVFTRMGGEFIPQLDEGSLALDMVRPVEISTNRSISQQALTEKIILKFPEVSHTFSRLGTSSVPADPSGINLGDTFVMLHPKKEWPQVNGKVRSKPELVYAIVDEVKKGVQEQVFMTTQPMQMRFNDLLEGTRADVSIKIFGSDVDTLEKISREIENSVKSVPGTGEIQLQLKARVPVLKITPKFQDLRQLGFGNETILAPVGVGYQGENVGNIYNGVQRFPIIVRLDHPDREDLGKMRQMPVGYSDDLQVPFEAAADIKMQETYQSLYRESSERRTAVLVSLKDRDVQSWVTEAMAKVEKEVKFPSGYSIEWGGNYKNLQNAKRSLSYLVPMTLLLVFFIIYMVFKKVSEALIIFCCVPLSLVGGIFALFLMGLNFSVSAGVGFIALFGISVLNGVILVSYYRELAHEGKKPHEAVKEGTKVLLRPILMTALVDAFGFLPMMLATGLGAEVQKPLAAVVVGGIISSTILAIFVLPLLYLFHAEKNHQDQEVGHQLSSPIPGE